MSNSPPFVGRESNDLNVRQIASEAVPIIGLGVLFGSLAAVPVLVSAVVPLGSPLQLALVLVAQFTLAVGVAIILVYIIARGIQLAGVGVSDG
jgi:hypothetical protein